MQKKTGQLQKTDPISRRAAVIHIIRRTTGRTAKNGERIKAKIWPARSEVANGEEILMSNKIVDK